MLTVRRRGIELATDPATFREDTPVAVFEDPERAKLEADAYLGLVINQVVEGMVQDEGRQQKVVDAIPDRIARSKPQYIGAPNSNIPSSVAGHAFKNAFLDAYSHNYPPLVATFSDTVLGNKTTMACKGYVEAADLKLGALTAFFKNHTIYKEPAMLLRTGLATFSDIAVDAICAINDSGLGIEQRAVHLAAAELSLRGLASLSLAQAQTRLIEKPVIEKGRLNLAPNIQEVRSHNQKSKHSEVRPHHGCPAMPSMPESDNLVAGSPLARLWQMASGLIVAANVHALDSDAPEHAIFPQTMVQQAV